MSKVTSQLSISLDGYVAGPNQSEADPIGEGGMRLHEWVFNAGDGTPDAQVRDQTLAGDGAYIMGRNMFGPIRGEWDESWRGWWGEDPPYHTPVYVLTHHPREPLEMQGGTTFHFVTDGPEAALEQARATAGERNVAIAGGAATVQQYLRMGVLDELWLHIAPVTLGAGERLLDGVGGVTLEPGEVVASPAATHVKYRVLR